MTQLFPVLSYLFSLRIAFVVLGSLVATTTQAQINDADAQASLAGITTFFVRADIERSGSLDDLDNLNLTTRIQQRLSEADLPLQNEQSDGPYLYAHLNALDMGRGLVPFSVHFQFIQPARLVRTPSSSLSVVTWETSITGLVSSDNLAIIGEATVALLDEFIAAFRIANP